MVGWRGDAEVELGSAADHVVPLQVADVNWVEVEVYKLSIGLLLLAVLFVEIAVGVPEHQFEFVDDFTFINIDILVTHDLFPVFLLCFNHQLHFIDAQFVVECTLVP